MTRKDAIPDHLADRYYKPITTDQGAGSAGEQGSSQEKEIRDLLVKDQPWPQGIGWGFSFGTHWTMLAF